MDGQVGVIGLPAVNPAEVGLSNVPGAVQTQLQALVVKASKLCRTATFEVMSHSNPRKK